jgi:hypothetical protein
VFGDAGTLLLNGAAMGTFGLESGELTLESGEFATRESVDAVLARIGYQYEGDSLPPKAANIVTPELTLAWRYVNSSGSSTTYLQTVHAGLFRVRLDQFKIGGRHHMIEDVDDFHGAFISLPSVGENHGKPPGIGQW